MARAIFVEDPEFETNILHWKDSLNPIGDKFRSVSDKYARDLKRNANQELNVAIAQTNELYSQRFRKSKRQQYKNAKALVYSLKKYVELIYAIEVHDAQANYSVVGSGHAAGLAIEYGGHDDVIMAGSEPLEYPPMRLIGRTLS